MDRHPKRRAVLVICDGQRRDMLGLGATPTFDRLAQTSTLFAAHRSAFPSVTRCCSATLATGCRPGRHGIHGNQMALPDGDGWAVHDVGRPEFAPAIRRAYGRVLKRPTMAERVASSGGAIIVANVSPGAAYMHDPEGHGEVYHRAGSFGPARRPLDGGNLVAPPTAEGDAAITEAFCEIVLPRRPALAVLWLSLPDKTMHEVPLGSPECLAAMRHADDCLAKVVAVVERQRAEGDDVLLMAGSDHGHRTVTGAVALERRLQEEELATPGTADVVVAPQGTAGLIYVNERAAARIPAIAQYLRSQDWCGPVFVGAELESVGLAAEDGLAIAFSTAEVEVAAALVPGAGIAVTRHENTAPHQGFGQHGGLGSTEQMPVLIASGGAFDPAVVEAPTDLTDIAPTVLAHLGLPLDGLDGRSLAAVANERPHSERTIDA